tara:strand:+ start:273 stop:632 length:360 start_codon:yes stop_codon:yes gene_type:complete
MNKIIIILGWLLSINKKVKLGDIKYMVDEEKMELKKNISKKDLKWTKEQNKLKKELLKGNYNQELNPPVLTRGNVCIDGHHRLSILNEVEDPNFKVKVKKVWLLGWSIFYKASQNHTSE